MRQTLSIATKLANFCYCPISAKEPGGWVVDEATGRSVHWACRKPAPLIGIRVCSNEDCQDEFIDFSQSKFAVLKDGRVIIRFIECDWCKSHTSVELR